MQVSQAFVFLITVIFDLFSFLIVARFLLQVARADFYNPISQSIVKMTDPLLKPMRRVIPGWGGFDVAALLLLLGIQIIKLTLTSFLSFDHASGALILMYAIKYCGSMFIKFFLYAIIIQVIASWIAPGNYNPILTLLHQVTEPLIAPIRRALPSVSGLDFSPMVAMILLMFLQKLLSL